MKYTFKACTYKQEKYNSLVESSTKLMITDKEEDLFNRSISIPDKYLCYTIDTNRIFINHNGKMEDITQENLILKGIKIECINRHGNYINTYFEYLIHKKDPYNSYLLNKGMIHIYYEYCDECDINLENKDKIIGTILNINGDETADIFINKDKIEEILNSFGIDDLENNKENLIIRPNIMYYQYSYAFLFFKLGYYKERDDSDKKLIFL